MEQNKTKKKNLTLEATVCHAIKALNSVKEQNHQFPVNYSSTITKKYKCSLDFSIYISSVSKFSKLYKNFPLRKVGGGLGQERSQQYTKIRMMFLFLFFSSVDPNELCPK